MNYNFKLQYMHPTVNDQQQTDARQRSSRSTKRRSTRSTVLLPHTNYSIVIRLHYVTLYYCSIATCYWQLQTCTGAKCQRATTCNDTSVWVLPQVLAHTSLAIALGDRSCPSTAETPQRATTYNGVSSEITQVTNTIVAWWPHGSVYNRLQYTVST